MISLDCGDYSRRHKNKVSKVNKESPRQRTSLWLSFCFRKSVKAAKNWDVHNIDQVPKQCKKPIKESDAEAAKASGERVKELRKREYERTIKFGDTAFGCL